MVLNHYNRVHSSKQTEAQKETEMNAININKAKQIDENFKIKEEKASAIEMWTTPEADYGFGYETAKFVKLTGNDFYELVLDGEGTHIWYGIFTNGETVEFSPTHYYGD